MIDFKALTERLREKRLAQWDVQGFCPAKVPPVASGCVVGVSGDASRICTWEISFRFYDDECEPIFSITEGGITGHESWYLYSLIECGLFSNEREWFYACAGGGGYPELKFKTKDVQEIVQKFLSKVEFFVPSRLVVKDESVHA